MLLCLRAETNLKVHAISIATKKTYSKNKGSLTISELKTNKIMTTITIECGKGLQSTLVEILEPLKLRKSDGKTNSRSTFELVGVLDNPVQKIKDYGKGIFECLNIISIE